MKNRFKWLVTLLAPDNPYHRHGAEMATRRPRMEQPHGVHHPFTDIDLDIAAGSAVHPGTMAAYRIALPSKRDVG